MPNTSETTLCGPAHPPQPATLLDWYERHGRSLPWRINGGRAPSPYHTWLSEIMLQQTTVATVAAYYHRFTARWPDIESLAHASEDDVLAEWAGLGYYSRARNLLKCARLVVERHGGVFPADVKALLALPGIGDYTANAIRAIAYDLPANVVDGNVERVIARVFTFAQPISLPKSKRPLKDLAASLAPMQRPGDYAQALMDLGATICTPRKPACGICPWRDGCCAYATGRTQDFPILSPKAKRPERHALFYALLDPDGYLLLQKNPSSGLLGGLWMLPATPWDKAQAVDAAPPAPHTGESLPEVVHVFTHFRLTMRPVLIRLASRADTAMSGSWFALDALPALPTVTKKLIGAIRIALGEKT